MCCGKKLRVTSDFELSKLESDSGLVKWEELPKNVHENGRENFWNSFSGDAEQKKIKCYEKVMGWIKDNDRALAYCQSLWSQFK